MQEDLSLLNDNVYSHIPTLPLILLGNKYVQENAALPTNQRVRREVYGEPQD